LLRDYAFILIFSLIALSVPILGLSIAWLVRPKKPGNIKNAIYECGLETFGETWVQFKVQYYIYALIFVIFDIETVFLYPWAVAYNQLIFILILAAGLLYAWRAGALEWV
jgi:NADH-quinone oxidoreductase subunit A